MRTESASGVRRGFTLIEVLIVIAVIAVLVGITLPGLRGGREASQRLMSLNNLKQLGDAITMYQGDHAGYYPALHFGVLYHRTEDFLFSEFWWTVAWNWPGPVYDYLPINHHVETYISPTSDRRGDPSTGTWPTSYWYSTSFVGKPRIWSGEPTHDYALMKAQRGADVLFASNKILLWDSEFGTRTHELKRDGPDIAEPMPMLAADGSGRVEIPAKATEAVPNPFQHPGYDLRLQNTRDGVRGIDYP